MGRQAPCVPRPPTRPGVAAAGVGVDGPAPDRRGGFGPHGRSGRDLRRLFPRQDGARHAAALGKALARWAARATNLVASALHQREQDVVGLLGRQRGIDPVHEGIHRLARRRRPDAVELAFVAAHARQLALQLASKHEPVSRKRGLLLRRPECGPGRERGKFGRRLVDVRHRSSAGGAPVLPWIGVIAAGLSRHARRLRHVQVRGVLPGDCAGDDEAGRSCNRKKEAARFTHTDTLCTGRTPAIASTYSIASEESREPLRSA